GRMPATPRTDISPRVGFAYDLSGDGRRVLRGGYGLYFDQINQNAISDSSPQNWRPLNALAVLTNTSIGVGQLATYRFGIDPIPAQPVEGNSLPPNSTGVWIGPDIVDPRQHHAHIGYAHELATNTMASVDFTHEAGTKQLIGLNLNPIVNGARLLAPDFRRVFGRPDVLGRAPPRGDHGRLRAAQGHSAFARLPGGERTPVQPHSRRRPERRREQQRPLHRSGDGHAGVDQFRARRRDGGDGPARDEVLRARRRAKGCDVRRSLQRAQQRQLRRKLYGQRPERRVPSAIWRIHPGHWIPAAA